MCICLMDAEEPLRTVEETGTSSRGCWDSAAAAPFRCFPARRGAGGAETKKVPAFQLSEKRGPFINGRACGSGRAAIGTAAERGGA